jgi:hypothetical protein
MFRLFLDHLGGGGETVKAHARLILAGLLLAAAVPVEAGDVRVSFSNGRVTIVATDASPRQIMSQWAQVGQVRITNLDRLAGGPVTLLLNDVPEAQALETLLRGTAGYVAAPRAPLAVAVSRYDRILLMPGPVPALPASPGQSTNPAQGMSRGRPAPPTFDPDDEDQPEPRMMVPGPNGMVREPARQGTTMPPQMLTPGQLIPPGQVMAPGTSPYSTGALPMPQTPTSAPLIPTYQTPQPPGATGTAVPGMPTTPLPIKGQTYSAPGSPGMPADDQTPPGPGVMSGAGTPGMPAAGRPPAGATTPGQVTPGMPMPIKK